jgi:hypothetical protein
MHTLLSDIYKNVGIYIKRRKKPRRQKGQAPRAPTSTNARTHASQSEAPRTPTTTEYPVAEKTEARKAATSDTQSDKPNSESDIESHWRPAQNGSQ